MNNGDIRCREMLVACDDDILPSRQSPFREGVESAPSHDDAVPHGDGLEMLEVGRQVTQQVSVASYRTVIGHNNDSGQFSLLPLGLVVMFLAHTDTTPLMVG